MQLVSWNKLSGVNSHTYIVMNEVNMLLLMSVKCFKIILYYLSVTTHSNNIVGMCNYITQSNMQQM